MIARGMSKVAVKCDMCKGLAGGAACVRLSNRRRVARFPREIPRLRERDRGLAEAPRLRVEKG